MRLVACAVLASFAACAGPPRTSTAAAAPTSRVVTQDERDRCLEDASRHVADLDLHCGFADLAVDDRRLVCDALEGAGVLAGARVQRIRHHVRMPACALADDAAYAELRDDGAIHGAGVRVELARATDRWIVRSMHATLDGAPLDGVDAARATRLVDVARRDGWNIVPPATRFDCRTTHVVGRPQSPWTLVAVRARHAAPALFDDDVPAAADSVVELLYACSNDTIVAWRGVFLHGERVVFVAHRGVRL